MLIIVCIIFLISFIFLMLLCVVSCKTDYDQKISDCQQEKYITHYQKNPHQRNHLVKRKRIPPLPADSRMTLTGSYPSVLFFFNRYR